MSSRELSTAGWASLCVELMVVAGDGGTESAELESVLVEVGIACTDTHCVTLSRETAQCIPKVDGKMTTVVGGAIRKKVEIDWSRLHI